MRLYLGRHGKNVERAGRNESCNGSIMGFCSLRTLGSRVVDGYSVSTYNRGNDMHRLIRPCHLAIECTEGHREDVYMLDPKVFQLVGRLMQRW